MAEFKFDGKVLKRGSKTIANISGDKICKESGSSTIANIRNDKICRDSGSTVLANIRGEKICSGSGSSSIGTMKDVDKAIDGIGGVTKAALWFVCVR